MHKGTALFFFRLTYLGAFIGSGVMYYFLITAMLGIDHAPKALASNKTVPEGSAVVEIYTLPHCSYCIKAKALLSKKGIKYKEFDVSKNPELRHAMVERSKGQRTVPQIFIHNQHVGGYEDLRSSEKNGELDKMLTVTPEEETSSEH